MAKKTPTQKVVKPSVETETKSQRQFNWRNGILELLLAILLILGIVWLIGQISHRGIQADTTSNVQTQENVQAQESLAGYVCSAVKIGVPTSTAGECKFCTINYSKPGVVYVVGETPMAYSEGAWVYQYNVGDVDGFKTCIEGQDFMSDPDYQPVFTWK
ncbi:MAG TPA: hypothetical protein PLT51_00680 [Candidatus Dojkabacteria bacterium]|nr:hypothetical protein [Candidatus Dojkabacteria bacterium]